MFPGSRPQSGVEIRLASQHDAYRIRCYLPYKGREPGFIHARHSQVRYDDRERAFLPNRLHPQFRSQRGLEIELFAKQPFKRL